METSVSIYEHWITLSALISSQGGPKSSDLSLESLQVWAMDQSIQISMIPGSLRQTRQLSTFQQQFLGRTYLIRCQNGPGGVYEFY